MLLNPKQGEKKDEYVARFVADPEMIGQYPESKARKTTAEIHYDDTFKKTSFDSKTGRGTTVREAEIFAVGKWNGLPFNEKDLQGIVESFKALFEFHKPPLKLGHNRAQKVTDGQPAIGWVDDVWVSGSKLMARFVDVPPIVIEAIEKKLYRTVSIELLRGVKFKGKSFSNVLDAVALLGADIPAVGNLADLKKLMGRDEILSGERLAFSAINGNLKEESTMTPEEIAKMQADLATANAKVVTAEAKVTVAEAEKATFAAKDKARDEADAQTKVDMTRKNIADVFETAVKDKKITPAQRTLFERTLRVDDDEAVVGISMDDVKALVGDGKVKDFAADQGATGGDMETKESNDVGLDISDKAYEFMYANEGCSFERATEMVMRKDRKLAKEYIDSNDNCKEVA